MGLTHDQALVEARKVDPEVTLDELKAAIRRRMTQENPQVRAAVTKQLRKNARRAALAGFV